MAEKAKKMIDLTKVKVVNVDGSEQFIDVSKDIASQYYQRAQNVEEAAACMDLFKNGKCEYSDNIKDGIIRLFDQIGISWPARQGIMAELEK